MPWLALWSRVLTHGAAYILIRPPEFSPEASPASLSDNHKGECPVCRSLRQGRQCCRWGWGVYVKSGECILNIYPPSLASCTAGLSSDSHR